MVTFLILLNLVVWGAFTFGLQNPTTTIQELRYYGLVAGSNNVYIWIVLQRVIIPIIIFFRFHSLVMLVECWKNTYTSPRRCLPSIPLQAIVVLDYRGGVI